MYWNWYRSGELKFYFSPEFHPGGTRTIFSSCFYKVGQVVCYEKIIIFNFKLKFCWNTFYTLTGCQKCCKLLLKIQMNQYKPQTNVISAIVGCERFK